MDIKIPSGPARGGPTDAVDGMSQAVDAAGDAAASVQEIAESAGSDAVSKIAEQVLAGKLSREEAVDRIVSEVMGSEIVKEAPPGIREEIAEILDALVATDPHLKSLISNIGKE